MRRQPRPFLKRASKDSRLHCLPRTRKAFRERRQRELAKHFPAIEDMTVLDLGGTAQTWDLAQVRPGRLVLLNMVPQQSIRPGMETIVGDACAPPNSVRRQHFDLVYSNSVIDQVGGHARRIAFAEQIHTLADHHWIQTAYRYFPLDPSWLFRLFSFFPSERASRSRAGGRLEMNRFPTRGRRHRGF